VIDCLEKFFGSMPSRFDSSCEAPPLQYFPPLSSRDPSARVKVRTFTEILLFFQVNDAAPSSDMGHGCAAAVTVPELPEEVRVSRQRKTASLQLQQLDSITQRYRARDLSMQQFCSLKTDATSRSLHPSEKNGKREISWPTIEITPTPKTS
jgi:hypothetical protein